MNDYLRDNPILFSIIVPVYRTEDFLPKCVDSILSQTYPRFELILVDDGSPDNCPQICDEYAQSDNRVHVIHVENGGTARARNIGIDAATGDYIMFTDSDDYWNSETALQSISNAVIEYQCDVLCTNLCKTYTGSRKAKRYFATSQPIIGTEQVLLSERYISSPCVKVIKSALFSDGRLDFAENIGSEDIDWSLRLALTAKSIAYIDISFYCYLQHNASSSHNMTEKKLYDLKSNVLFCINLLQKQEISTQRVLTPYICYQYAILLLNIATVGDIHQQASFLSGVQDNCGLLKASSSTKIRAMNIFCRLFGFQRMMEVLSLYAKLRNKEPL